MSLYIANRRKPSSRYLEKVKIMPGDITAQKVDAIVTALPLSLEYRGSLNTKIAEAAGTDLDAFIKDNIFNPRIGDIYAVPGFGLPANHIFFLILPPFKDDFDRTDRQLLNACRKAMEEARNMGLKNIAFPPVGTGSRGFPKERGARLILQGIADRLDSVFEKNSSFEEVRINARTEETCRIFRDRIAQMQG